MIESIRTRNFQVHQNTKIVFDKLVTTIIGPNDVGKSALFRSLVWTLTNQPRGMSFLRHGKERVSTILNIDGHKVVRTRSRRKNTYKLDCEPFAAFGSGVPDELANLFNVDDINFQGQHDASGFWFSLRPGEVSKRLNQVVDLGLIDSTLLHLNRTKRRFATQVDLIQERLDEAKEQKHSLGFVSKARKSLDRLLTLEKSHNTLKTNLDKLQDLTASVRAGEQMLANLQARADAASMVLKTRELWERIRIAHNKLWNIFVCIEAAQDVISRSIPNLTNLEELAQKKQHTADMVEELRTVLSVHTATKRRVQTLHKQHIRYRILLRKKLGGKPCPLCNEIPSRQ